MDAQLVPIALTAGASVLTTVLALLYGPAWKDRVDARRARQQRSDQLLARYSEPLARAAYDLQSRLYNICRRSIAPQLTLDEYNRHSTLWLFGQFLAWVEIVRREIQIIDYGDVGRTAALQRHLLDVSDILASNSIKDRRFRLFRAEQRAIGELMVVDRKVDGATRSDSMGYSEFVQCMETEREFSRWFEPLVQSMEDLGRQGSIGVRAILMQRSLIDIIDFFDPSQVRFPDVNERGKVPRPDGVTDRKRDRPHSAISRFRYVSAGDPLAIVNAWAEANCLKVSRTDGRLVVRLPRRSIKRRYIVVTQSSAWTEIHITCGIDDVDRGKLAPRNAEASPLKLSTSHIKLVNTLLHDLDRPRLVSPHERSLGR